MSDAEGEPYANMLAFNAYVDCQQVVRSCKSAAALFGMRTGRIPVGSSKHPKQQVYGDPQMYMAAGNRWHFWVQQCNSAVKRMLLRQCIEWLVPHHFCLLAQHGTGYCICLTC